MARTLRDAKLETRTARDKLKPSGKPYWRGIEQGLHIGYRKHSKGGGKWVMRRHVGGAKVYEVETIALADDIIDADGATILNFKQAQDEIRRRVVAAKMVAVGLPAEAEPYRVRHAIADTSTFSSRRGKVVGIPRCGLRPLSYRSWARLRVTS